MEQARERLQAGVDGGHGHSVTQRPLRVNPPDEGARSTLTVPGRARSFCPMRTALSTALLGGLTACTGATDTGAPVVNSVEFRVQIQPLLPVNQRDIFTGADTVTLSIREGGSEAVEYDLEAIDGGFIASELAALDAAVVRLTARDLADQVIGWGQTPPLTIEDGTDENFTMLFAEPERIARWNALPEALHGGQLVWDGAGRFLLFGGATQGTRGNQSGLSSVWALSSGTTLATTGFEEVGVMPALLGNDSNAPQGRYGHSATLLTGNHADNGKILVVGGAADHNAANLTDDKVFLWDPATDSAETLETRVNDGVYLHQAVESPNGDVVLIGGFSDSGLSHSFVFAQQSHYYDAGNRAVRNVNLTGAQAFHLFASGAALNNSGVLVCGGTDIAEIIRDEDDNPQEYYFALGAGCDLIGANGALEPLTGSPPPERVLFADMVTLADGTVLMSGGAAPLTDPDRFELNDGLTSTAEAWLFDGSTWTETRLPMNVPRAGHRSALLPDGRVLIFGGVTALEDPLPSGEDAVACVEIYNPETRDFALLDANCDSTAVTASLEEPLAWPMVAVDPDRGVLTVGGLGTDDRSRSFNAMYVVQPSD